jgi:signal transduction histidine kinase
MQQLRRRLSHGRSFADPVLGVAVTAVYAAELVAWDAPHLPLTLTVAAVGGLGLALRRRLPLLGFVLVGTSIQALERLAPGFDNDSAALVISIFVALYSLGRHAGGLEAWLGGLGVLAFVVLFVVGEHNAAPVDSGDVGFALLFVGTPWAAGLAIRVRREREHLLHEHNLELQRDQGARARAAVAAERSRIARELHDVVSHAIAVTVLQARGGRKMLGVDEEEVRRSLDAIERTNTQALSDMRRLLSLLRDTEDGDHAGDGGRSAPQPSLERLDDLVDDVRASGLPVELQVSGRSEAVPPGVDLSAYRIIQEALTNVLKHAGSGAEARVEIDYADDRLEVVVLDDGSTPDTASASYGRGQGLVGIRERVAVVGGRVETGPRPEGGFAVRALLPYSVETS